MFLGSQIFLGLKKFKLFLVQKFWVRNFFLVSISLSLQVSLSFCHFPSNVVFRQWLSSIKCCFPSKVVFHQRQSSIKGSLPSKVVFHQRSSSIKGRFPSKVVFHQRSLLKGLLHTKVVFHRFRFRFHFIFVQNVQGLVQKTFSLTMNTKKF